MTTTLTALRAARLTLLNVEKVHTDVQVAAVQTCNMTQCDAHKEKMLLINCMVCWVLGNQPIYRP